MAIRTIPKSITTDEQLIDFYKSEILRLNKKIEKELKKSPPTPQYTVEEAKELIFELFDINPEMKLPTVSMFKYNQKKFKKNADYIKYIELRNIVTGDFDKMCQLWYESRNKEIENLKEDIQTCQTLIKNIWRKNVQFDILKVIGK